MVYQKSKIETKTVICWWSGGIASAVACFIALETFGKENCRIIMIDTKNEDDDTYRFKRDCEKWYGQKIETITAVGKNKKYGSIEDVWYQFGSLDVATGAICSSELKRQVRLDFQRRNNIKYQVFGFDFDKKESNRALNIKKNYPKSNPIFPLWMFGYTKKDCIKIVESAGIEIPEAYRNGFQNNNCIKTGCVQGGIGYWQLYQKQFPERFAAMAKREHEITEQEGKPVTVCKDQSNEAKVSGKFNVFLLPHPDYPEYKDLSMMEGREPESLIECNGFCGIQGNLFKN